MSKWREKPVVIEAVLFFPTDKPWPEGVEEYIREKSQTVEGVNQTRYGWRIQTLEGPRIVSPGDWIITGVKGERYPCKPDIFEATYDAVEERDPRCNCTGVGRHHHMSCPLYEQDARAGEE